MHLCRIFLVPDGYWLEPLAVHGISGSQLEFHFPLQIIGTLKLFCFSFLSPDLHYSTYMGHKYSRFTIHCTFTLWEFTDCIKDILKTSSLA